jgi:hypothetical protein
MVKERWVVVEWSRRTKESCCHFASRDPIASTSPWCHTAAHPTHPMDQNSVNSHSTRSTFFSRVYPTPQSSNSPRSYPSTTRPHTNAPSFFGKSHTPHSAGRNPENHIANQNLQGGDGSALLPLENAEDGSIYVGHKYPQYLSRSIEATESPHPYDNMDSASHISHSSRHKLSLSASRTGMLDGTLLSLESRFSVCKGTRGKHRQCRSPDDLAGDKKQNLGGGEFPVAQRLWDALTFLM